MSSDQSKSSKKISKAKYAIGISIGLHILFYLVTHYIPKPQLNENIVIDLNDVESVNNLDYIKDEADLKKLVEFDKTTDDQKEDPKAKYLAAKNNQVQKETLAKLDQTFKNVEKSKPAQQVAKEETTEKNPWDKEKSDEAKLFNTGFDVYNKMQNKNVAKQKRQPSADQPQQESTATDKLEDTDQSLMTQLNTKEYKYYGYYTRIRQQLNQWWQPKVKEKVSKLMSTGRTIASKENKNTKVIIVLDTAGALVKVQVLGASGIRELDDAAVEAFRQAAPFPNPPKGIVDADGTIKIRWDFIVES
jgi:TonB family protein